MRLLALATPTVRRLAAVGATLLFALVLAAGCGGVDDEHFVCGEGECQRGVEVCVIDRSNGCSACVSAPAECTSCDCLPDGKDEAYGDRGCSDPGTCEDVEGGAVLTCDADGWSCG